MTPELWIAVITMVVSVSASVLGSLLVFRVNNKRMGSQNNLDDMSTAKIALEISEGALSKQREQEVKIRSLESILKNRRYRVTVDFQLGEQPHVLSASIEAINLPVSVEA